MYDIAYFYYMIQSVLHEEKCFLKTKTYTLLPKILSMNQPNYPLCYRKISLYMYIDARKHMMQVCVLMKRSCSTIMISGFLIGHISVLLMRQHIHLNHIYLFIIVTCNLILFTLYRTTFDNTIYNNERPRPEL